MLPQKLFFRIGEVAGLVGVEPHVLRYWEREFRSIRPTKSAKGQRVYSRKDVENLLRVRDLLYRDGFTIAGAKKKLQRHDGAVEIEAAAPEPVAREATPHSAVDDAERAPVAAVESVPVAPEPAPRAAAERRPPGVREKLIEIRLEVETFLAELSSTAAGAAERRSSSGGPGVDGASSEPGAVVRAPAIRADGRR